CSMVLSRSCALTRSHTAGGSAGGNGAGAACAWSGLKSGLPGTGAPVAADSGLVGLAGLAAGAFTAVPAGLAGAAAGLICTGVAKPVRTCAAAGHAAVIASAVNSMKDFARLLIGCLNPFISNEDPRVQAYPYTRFSRLARDSNRRLLANQSLSEAG